MSRYPVGLKERLLIKAFSPNAPSIVELARESGVSYSTLYSWIYMSKKKHIEAGVTPMRPKDKTAEAKLQAVFDTLQMTDEERSTYCRKHGLYAHHLDEWKKQVLAGLNPVDSKEDKAEQRLQSAEIKKLKGEINRKDRALAEASALLILKKKANLIWGDGKDD